MRSCCFFLPSLNIGGVENVFITYSNELSTRGYRVSFVLCKKEGDLLKNVSNDVIIYDLGGIKLRMALFPLRQYIKKRKPDVIITGGDFPNLICILATRLMKNRPRVIISKHNYRNVETKNLGWWAKFDLKLQKFLYPKADKIIAVSKGIERYLINELNIEPNKIAQICNPIDIDVIIKKGEQSINYTLPKDYVVFVGRLGKVKNLSLLLKAFNHVDDENLYLVIVGDGPEREPLERLAKSLPCCKKVVFIGSVSNPMPIIKEAKSLILCSFSEAYPTILLEAMAFNVPIVATPTEGAKEILEGIEGAFLASSFDNEDEVRDLINKAIIHKASFMREYLYKNEKHKIVDIMEREIKKCIGYDEILK